jgi:pimeloyl-ACP methyl ester carboxylesterase
MTSRWPLLGISVVLCAGLVACDSTQPQSTPESSSDSEQADAEPVEWTPCPDDYLVRDPARSFDGDDVDCSAIVVPAVYEAPSDLPGFQIAMMRLPSTGPAKDSPTLFINPGGPGGSGIEELQEQDIPDAIRKNYDVVGFDPRGVLHSQPVEGNPIRCSDSLDFASYWNTESTPDNQEQADEAQRVADEYYDDCESHNPGWWTLGTQNVVRDLDMLRERVTGDDGLNFLGSSYGTTIGAGYLRMYPDRVDHLVLDSPTSDVGDSDSAVVARAGSMEAQLLRLAQGYAKARGTSLSQVKAELQQIRQWGDDDELMGYLGLNPSPDNPNVRLSTESAFVQGLIALTYYDASQVQHPFNQAMDQLLKNKWNGYFEFLSFQMDGYDTQEMFNRMQNGEPYDPQAFTRDNSFEIRQMVNGIDSDQRLPKSEAKVDALEEKYRTSAPLLSSLQHDEIDFKYYPPSPGNPWSWAALDDPEIPDPPAHATTWQNQSGAPVMVIGSQDESTTPYPFAVRTAKDLKSPLITWDGSDHAPLAGFRHQCLNQLFVDYLVHDRLPEAPLTCSR